MKSITVIFLLFFVVSCSNTQKTSVQEVSEQETENPKPQFNITKSDIESINYIEFVLGTKGIKALSSWDKFTELNKIIDDVKNGNLSYFRNNSEVITAFTKDFKTSLPEPVNSSSVTSRISVIENAIYKLESVLNLNTSDKSEVIKAIKEFLEAYSNFILQVNKKFEKEGQRIEIP